MLTERCTSSFSTSLHCVIVTLTQVQVLGLMEQELTQLEFENETPESLDPSSKPNKTVAFAGSPVSGSLNVPTGYYVQDKYVIADNAHVLVLGLCTHTVMVLH